jgi:hypothetical protein
MEIDIVYLIVFVTQSSAPHYAQVMRFLPPLPVIVQGSHDRPKCSRFVCPAFIGVSPAFPGCKRVQHMNFRISYASTKLHMKMKARSVRPWFDGSISCKNYGQNNPFDPVKFLFRKYLELYTEEHMRIEHEAGHSVKFTMY